jgi:hypothetical protein
VSRPLPADTAELPLPEDPFGSAAALRRRRLDSARARRRRLLGADLAIGVALGVLGLILAPGLAIAALGAILVLAGCALAAVAGLARRRRQRPRRGEAPRGRSAA